MKQNKILRSQLPRLVKHYTIKKNNLQTINLQR